MDTVCCTQVIESNGSHHTTTGYCCIKVGNRAIYSYIIWQYGSVITSGCIRNDEPYGIIAAQQVSMTYRIANVAGAITKIPVIIPDTIRVALRSSECG